MQEREWATQKQRAARRNGRAAASAPPCLASSTPSLATQAKYEPSMPAGVHNAGSEPVFSEIGRRVRVRLVGQSCGVRRRYDDEGSSAALHSARRHASAKVKGRNGPTCCFAFGRAWALPSERPPKYAIVVLHLPVLRTCGAQPADVCVLPCASVGRTTSLVGD